MSFKDIQLRGRYNTAKHDVAKEFYIPVLSECRTYRRISCYFSSSSLNNIAIGISNFIKNGDTMYLIIGNSISEEDADALMRGYLKMDDLLLKKWEDCISFASGDITLKNRFEALSWLLANDKLKVKIGVNVDQNGNAVSSDISKFHEKMMIFEDSEGNIIQTDGSNNETGSAFTPNRENFAVHKSWVGGNDDIINDAMIEFNELWDNEDEFSRTYDIPNALYEKIIEFAPKEMPEIDGYERPSGENKRKLRKYQTDAIDSWVKNDYKGILEMATGTGKTFTALSAAKLIAKDGMCLIITVPQKELAEQWIDDCRDMFGQEVPLLDCRSNTGWRDISKVFARLTKTRFSVIVSVIDTFVSDDFQDVIRAISGEIVMISDEVHEMGAAKSMGALIGLDLIRYRLGLSATPKDAWDTERNDKLSDFYGDVIFSWDLKKAISPPPGYDPCLVPYNYMVRFSHLNDDELNAYYEISNDISKLLAKKKRDPNVSFKQIMDGNPMIQRLLFKRATLVQSSKDRHKVMMNIIRDNMDILNKCIIYCENISEIKNICSMINSIGYDSIEYHSNLNKDERRAALNDFRNGTSRFIVSVGCLDQGVDIPNCDSAIIMSSSKNPREYVQRRGRILRLNGNSKIMANIFDIVVLPYEIEWILNNKDSLSNIEADLIRSQLKRLDTFTDDAINKGENRKLLIDLKNIVGDDDGWMDRTDADQPIG